MDHHHQHHQHHQKEREERIQHEKERERQSEKAPWKIHPTWFVILGTVLVLLVILTWFLATP
jgi:type VI protein secretion system component VasF